LGIGAAKAASGANSKRPTGPNCIGIEVCSVVLGTPVTNQGNAPVLLTCLLVVTNSRRYVWAMSGPIARHPKRTELRIWQPVAPIICGEEYDEWQEILDDASSG
jgi:hypothetical protein